VCSSDLVSSVRPECVYEGRICLDALEEGYTENSLVVELLQTVKELFLRRSFSTPVQIEKVELYRNNRTECDQRLRRAVTQQAKSSVEERLES
jgi:ubiquitin-protein ligase